MVARDISAEAVLQVIPPISALPVQ